MIRSILSTTVLLLFAAATARAGTLKDGQWSASGCGAEPAAVSLDATSVEAYNRGIEKAKTWEQQAKAYVACMVAEGNADNGAIVKAVNDAQARIKDGFEHINAKATEAQEKFSAGKQKISPP